MKKLITICLVCVLLSAQAIVSAESLPLPTKWTQLPNMETGIDYGSMRGWVIAADDYLCENPLPVTDVHWWGSYWASVQDPQPINGFTISFYSDVPASPTGEFSHPGDLLYTAYVRGNCSETYYGYSQSDGTNVYQYNTMLPQPFEQDYRTIYWLSIQVDQGWEMPPYWGWHNSIDHWQDGAVQAIEPPPWTWWNYSDDLAFELTVIPEPMTICLLGLGALSLLRRKR